MATDKTTVTRTIHWASALIIMGLLASGLYMTDGNDYSFYPWHKSFGVIALGLILLRLYYKSRYPWHSFAEQTSKRTLVKAAHYFLLAASLFMPLSGLALSGFGGYGVDVFGFTLIPNNYDATGQAQPFSESGLNIGRQIHIYLGVIFTALVCLHILAALKHHFLDKDLTLKRMLSRRYTQSEV